MPFTTKTSTTSLGPYKIAPCGFSFLDRLPRPSRYGLPKEMMPNTKQMKWHFSKPWPNPSILKKKLADPLMAANSLSWAMHLSFWVACLALLSLFPIPYPTDSLQRLLQVSLSYSVSYSGIGAKKLHSLNCLAK